MLLTPELAPSYHAPGVAPGENAISPQGISGVAPGAFLPYTLVYFWAKSHPVYFRTKSPPGYFWTKRPPGYFGQKAPQGILVKKPPSGCLWK